MPSPEPSFTTRPTLTGTHGMAASTHWLATGTAQSVLERGGTAIDAAVAAAFVLHVAEPHLNGPGGDLVALVQFAGGDRPVVLNGQGPAPAAATIAHFRSEGLDRVPGAGGLAAAVPGAVESWLWLLQTHGTWSVHEVLQYAIHWAEFGVPVSGGLAAAIESVAELFTEFWPTSAERWLDDEGRAPRTGDIVRNPDLAGVWREVLAAATASDRVEAIEQARTFWREDVLRRAVEFTARPHRHSTGTDHAGVLTAQDVRDFRPTLEPAAQVGFRDATVFKAGTWNAGPALLEALGILDGSSDEDLDLTTPRGVHTVVEVLKLAMADRDGFLGEGGGDPDVVQTLLAPDYLRERRAEVGDTASLEFRPGSPGGRTPYRPPLVTPEEFGDLVAPGFAGEPTVRADDNAPAEIRAEVRGDTVHLDVVDRFGNLVSATPSGGWLQSSPTIPGTGFCLGTRLQMAWLDENSPSRLEPGLRPRTTLTPTIVHRGTERISLGTPGGDQQDQWQLQYLLRTIVSGWSAQAAIDAPMFASASFPGSFWPRTWKPGELTVEERFDDGLLADLSRRGHRVVRSGPWTLGRLSMVSRDEATGLMRAAANPRGGTGYAAGR